MNTDLSWSNTYVFFNRSAVPLKRVQFSHQYSQMTPHSSPVRARCGVFFVVPASDWYVASNTVFTYVLYYNIGPRYNGIRLNRLFCSLWRYMSQIFSIPYCWEKIVGLEFRLIRQWINIDSDDGLTLNGRSAIVWTSHNTIHINASHLIGAGT